MTKGEVMVSFETDGQIILCLTLPDGRLMQLDVGGYKGKTPMVDWKDQVMVVNGEWVGWAKA